MNTYRDEQDEIFTEAHMRSQWAEDIASMDPESVDLQDHHSFSGWLADMLSWGRYTEIDEDDE